MKTIDTTRGDNDLRYEVLLESDKETLVTDVINCADYDIKENDSVLLYLIDGNLSNVFIIGVRGKTSLQSARNIMTTSGETVSLSLFSPEQIFTYPCAGSVTFVQGATAEDYYAVVPCSLGSGLFANAWWKVG